MPLFSPIHIFGFPIRRLILYVHMYNVNFACLCNFCDIEKIVKINCCKNVYFDIMLITFAYASSVLAKINCRESSHVMETKSANLRASKINWVKIHSSNFPANNLMESLLRSIFTKWRKTNY